MRGGRAVIARERAVAGTLPSSALGRGLGHLPPEGKAIGDLPCAPSDLVQRFDAVGIHPCTDLGGDAGAGLRVKEVRSAHLYCRRTGHDELQRVTAGQDTAQTHDRDADARPSSVGGQGRRQLPPKWEAVTKISIHISCSFIRNML